MGEDSRADSARTRQYILRAVLESPRDIVIFALDQEYRYLAFNEAHRRTIAAIWQVEIAVGQCMLDIIGREDDRAKARANFDRALAGEHFVRVEEYGQEGPSRRYYEDVYSPIVAADGAVIGLTVFLSDITEQTRAQRELEEYKVRLESLVDDRTAGPATKRGALSNAGRPCAHRGHGASRRQAVVRESRGVGAVRVIAGRGARGPRADIALGGRQGRAQRLRRSAGRALAHACGRVTRVRRVDRAPGGDGGRSGHAGPRGGHLRAQGGRGGATGARRTAPAHAEAGELGPARGRDHARLQQPFGRHPRQRRARAALRRGGA